MRCQHYSRNYGCDKAVEANKTKATEANEADDAKDKAKATYADEADEAKATEADEADKANKADLPNKALDATEANKAKATEADEANEAKANDTDEANEPMIQQGCQVDEANDTIAANDANKAGNATLLALMLCFVVVDMLYIIVIQLPLACGSGVKIFFNFFYYMHWESVPMFFVVFVPDVLVEHLK